jgi:hypothetical protein
MLYPPNIKGWVLPLFLFFSHRSCLFASLLLFCSSFTHFHHLLLLFFFHCLLLLLTCFRRLLGFIAPPFPLLVASPLAIVIACVTCFHHLLFLFFCYLLFHHCPPFRYQLPTPVCPFLLFCHSLYCLNCKWYFPFPFFGCVGGEHLIFECWVLIV